MSVEIAVFQLAVSGTFNDAGIWAAIVAGGVALLGVVGGVARWVWKTLQAPELEGALYPATTVLQFKRDRPGPGLVQFESVLLIANGTTKRLWYQVLVFTLAGSDWTAEITKFVEPQHVPPGHAGKAWVRDPVNAHDGETVALNYQIVYGRAPSRPRRMFSGQTSFNVSQPTPTASLSAPEGGIGRYERAPQASAPLLFFSRPRAPGERNGDGARVRRSRRPRMLRHACAHALGIDPVAARRAKQPRCHAAVERCRSRTNSAALAADVRTRSTAR